MHGYGDCGADGYDPVKRILALHPSTELYGADKIFASVVQFFGEDNYSVDVVLKNDGKLAAYIASKNYVATFEFNISR